MIRISGGEYRGRYIESPSGHQAIRPTTALVRESVFNRVQNKIQDSRFLDLFAGSGIMGIEALSRGAAFVLAIEKQREHCFLIKRNYKRLGIPIGNKKQEGEFKVQLLCESVIQVLSQSCPYPPFNLVFLDPPYGWPHLETLLLSMEQNQWVAADGIIIIEHGSRETDLTGFQRKKYGESSISIKTRS